MPSLSVVPDSEPAVDFPSFWTLYPRHVARKAAQKAWDRLTPDYQLEALTAIVKWRRIWAQKDLEFVPHASSWLNGERFFDDLPGAPSTGVLDTFKPLPAIDRRGIPPEVAAELARIRGKR